MHGRRHVHEQLTHAVQEAVKAQMGSECLLLIINALHEEGTKVLDEAKHATAAQAQTPQQSMRSMKGSQIGRRAIWYAFNRISAAHTRSAYAMSLFILALFLVNGS